MSVTLTGTGGLFTRLGRIFFGIESANVYSGTTSISGGELKPLGTTFTDIMDQFESTLQNLTDQLFTNISSQRSNMSSIKSALGQLATITVIEQVNADAVLPSKDIGTAITELIRQMIGSGTVFSPDNDVDAPAVSATVATVTGITNTGTGNVVASVLRVDGRTSENVFAEVIEITLTSDVSSGATARSETASFKGEQSVADPLAFDWPVGSSCSGSLQVIDASIDSTVGNNLLTNSDFEDQTSNVPDNWTLLVGIAGTTIITETSIVYRAGKCVEFVGDAGGTLTSIAQTVTSFVDLKPNTVYHLNCWMRKTAGIAAGVIQIALLDSGNSILDDDAGVDNAFTQTATALSSASFTAVSGSFRTPKTLVTGVTTAKVTVRVSTALTSGESVFVDDLAMTEAVRAYSEGPLLSIFAGSVNFLRGDRFNVTIANNRAGEFQEWFDRVFNMKSLQLQLPSDTAATETISDTLIA